MTIKFLSIPTVFLRYVIFFIFSFDRIDILFNISMGCDPLHLENVHGHRVNFEKGIE